jgi:hypothetical protein
VARTIAADYGDRVALIPEGAARAHHSFDSLVFGTGLRALDLDREREIPSPIEF